MFIKKTIKTDRSTGKKYSSYYLVESSRTVKGPRQRTLLYMCSVIGLPQDEHKFLAQCIEEIVAGQQSPLPYSEDIARLAQLYAFQLIRHLSKDDSGAIENEYLEPEFLSIDINSIEKSEPRSVGAEHFMLQMAYQLEIPQKLQKLGLS